MESNSPIDSLARNLEDLLNKFDISPAEYQKMVNISPKNVYNILQAATDYRVSTLEEIANSFGLTGWQLLAGGLALTKARSPRRLTFPLASWAKTPTAEPDQVQFHLPAPPVHQPD